MNHEFLQAKMNEFFANVTPEELITEFEALGYKFEPIDRLDKVTRVEVIDENGRAYVNWKKGNKVELSYQDSDRTLKIFITNETRK